MTGFDRKMVHLRTDKTASFEIEIDFLGDGSWVKYKRVAVSGGYARHVFPAGFSAHRVRLTPATDFTASVEFFYT